MLIGMGVVFAFLISMVVLMTAVAAFFRKFAHLFPEAEPEVKKASPSGGGASRVEADPSTKLAVAVAAAFRARKG